MNRVPAVFNAHKKGRPGRPVADLLNFRRFDDKVHRAAHGVRLAGKIVVVLAGLPDGFEFAKGAFEVVVVIAGQFVDACGFKLAHARIKGAEAACQRGGAGVELGSAAVELGVVGLKGCESIGEGFAALNLHVKM